MQGEFWKFRPIKDSCKIVIFWPGVFIKIRTGNNPPEIFWFQITIILILYKQSENRISLLKIDLHIVLLNGSFAFQEILNVLYIHIEKKLRWSVQVSNYWENRLINWQEEIERIEFISEIHPPWDRLQCQLVSIGDLLCLFQPHNFVDQFPFFCSYGDYKSAWFIRWQFKFQLPVRI